MGIRFRAGWTATTLLFVIAAVSAFRTWRVSAAGENPPGPDRVAVVTQDYTSYEWWLTGWEDNKVACSITIDHEGAPTNGEIYATCGATIYEKWMATKSCETSEENPETCTGYYLVFFKSEPAQREVIASFTQNYTSYEWWLVDWKNNKVACLIMTDHGGTPTNWEIYTTCGPTLYRIWSTSLSCETSEENIETCTGYYLVFFKSEPAQREVSVVQPPPVVWVTLEGCEPVNSTFRCDKLPTLILTGEEPMEGEHITNIGGRLDGVTFTCDPVCQVDLAPTEEKGLTLEFWANSSYGDSSVLFTARVRVVASDEPGDHSWYVDVLSTQWRGAELAGCSQTWDVFPPVGGVPVWLSTPPRAEDLATSIPYEYLAANLIKHGVVDTSACTDGGLLEDGLVSPCGLQTARSAVNDWQNRFDTLIINAAQDTGVPAQLLKSIFSRESQFWPDGAISHPEAGLGQMTDGGADTTFLWNQPFYEQFCPSVLDGALCGGGYVHLNADQQVTLRKALVDSVKASCPDCALGIDMGRADKSVGIFAESLIANCNQAGMVVDLNNTKNAPVAYEDLWKFTLVNYNAGPGCLGLAVNMTSAIGEPLNWKNVSSHLTPACKGALNYITDISGASP
jgi:hypothetical protein